MTKTLCLGVCASVFLAGCTGQSLTGPDKLGSGVFQMPVVESLGIQASSTLSSDQRASSVLFQDVQARVDGVGVGDRFFTLELPILPTAPGRIDTYLDLRGSGVVTDGRVELWQMSPRRELLWASSEHSGPFYVRTTLSSSASSASVVAGAPVSPLIARASFYLRAVSRGPDGALLAVDSADASFDEAPLAVRY